MTMIVKEHWTAIAIIYVKVLKPGNQILRETVMSEIH